MNPVKLTVTDVERKYGLRLGIVFNALEIGVYLLEDEGEVSKIEASKISLHNDGLYYECSGYRIDGSYFEGLEKLNPKDYGVTWALTKEQLI